MNLNFWVNWAPDFNQSTPVTNQPLGPTGLLATAALRKFGEWG